MTKNCKMQIFSYMSKKKEKFNKLEFSENLLVKQDKKAMLIRVSNKSELSGYVFWWPTRFFRRCDKAGYRTLMFKDSDVFHVRKYCRFSNHEDSELIDLKVIPSSEISELLQEEN